MVTPENSNDNASAPVAMVEAAEPAAPHPSAGGRIRTWFLTGLIVAGPVAITFWLIWSFVTWVDELVRPFIPIMYRPATRVGRTLVEAGETILERMPIVRPLYRGLKQVFETLFSKSGSSFRKVALVEFPAPGMWSIVFLSSPPGSDIEDHLPSEDEYV